jgi:hypothetical protein
MVLVKQANNNDVNWFEEDTTEIELLLDEDLDDVDAPDSVMMEARDMLNRLQNKSHRRGKPERSLRRTQAWS